MRKENKTRMIVLASAAVIGLSTLPKCDHPSEDGQSWSPANTSQTVSPPRPAHDQGVNRYPSRELIDQIGRSDSLPIPTPRPTRQATIY